MEIANSLQYFCKKSIASIPHGHHVLIKKLSNQLFANYLFPIKTTLEPIKQMNFKSCLKFLSSFNVPEAYSELTIYAIVYFFIMSYKYILKFQSFTLFDHKKYMTYSILLHSFTLTFRFHYNFVHLNGFYESIVCKNYSIKTLISDLISNNITT